MEYINIPLYVIRSNEYIGADPTQRATWLSLIAWSCDQENMGRIAGARSWGDRRWMQSCGVMASEVAESCGLFYCLGIQDAVGSLTIKSFGIDTDYKKYEND